MSRVAIRLRQNLTSDDPRFPLFLQLHLSEKRSLKIKRFGLWFARQIRILNLYL